jgi:hypothetical protein
MQQASYKQLVKTIKSNDVYRAMDSYRTVVQLTLKGVTRPIQFVGGRAGVGKSYVVREECQKLGIVPALINPTSSWLFYRSLYRHRNAQLILMDDTPNTIIRAGGNLAILKMAYDPGGSRIVNWGNVESLKNEMKAKGKRRSDVPPSHFKVTGKLIWVSNNDLNDPAEKYVEHEMEETLNAIYSRGANPIFVDGSDEDIFRYTIWLATAGSMFPNSKRYISKLATEQAVNWYNINRNRVKRSKFSPRGLDEVGELMHNCNLQKIDDKRRHVVLNLLLEDKDIRKLPGFGELKMESKGKWTDAKEVETATETISPIVKTTQQTPE